MQKPRKNGIILGFVTVFMINMNDNQSLYDIIQKLKLNIILELLSSYPITSKLSIYEEQNVDLKTLLISLFVIFR